MAVIVNQTDYSHQTTTERKRPVMPKSQQDRSHVDRLIRSYQKDRSQSSTESQSCEQTDKIISIRSQSVINRIAVKGKYQYDRSPSLLQKEKKEQTSYTTVIGTMTQWKRQYIEFQGQRSVRSVRSLSFDSQDQCKQYPETVNVYHDLKL